MNKQIQVKTSTSKPEPAKQIRAWAFGHEASVQFGPIEIFGHAQTLAAELRRLADLIEPGNVNLRHAQRISQEMPLVMATPETAWPWLVRRFPWLFNEIDTSREPYGHFLKQSQAEQDATKIAHLINPSQADVAQALFNDRTKTGGSYRRRILAAIETTTTAEHTDLLSPAEKKAA